MITLFVLTLLCRNNTILLAKRINKQFGNDQYSIIGGKVETDESGLNAAIREAYEETGLILEQKNLTFVHALHRKGLESNFVALCFIVNLNPLDTPTNKEPEKHADLTFFPIDKLPENILPAHKQVIECISKNIPYSEHNWT